MEQLLGWSTLYCAGLITFLICYKYPKLGLILGVAFTLRVAAACFHYYVAPLPDSQGDAVAFQNRAWLYSLGGVSGVVEAFEGPDSFFISVVLGFFYALAGPSELMAQGFSVLFGTLNVFLVWKLAREVWNDSAAKKAAWAAAFFPTLILYSAITLREVYIVFSLLLGLIWVTRWSKNGGIRPIVYSVAAFIGGTFFHGGMAVGIIAFFVLIALRETKNVLVGFLKSHFRIVSIFTVLIAVLGIGGYVASGIKIPKLGTPQQLVDIDRLTEKFESATRDSARYPEWTMPQSAPDMLLKAPIKLPYFLFAPFPWDIRSPRHLIGLVDGLLYFLVVLSLWRNRKIIKTNPEATAIFFVLAGCIFVFGMSTGNFGNGLRHRAKFITGGIVLIAPFLYKNIFKKHLPRRRIPRTQSE